MRTLSQSRARHARTDTWAHTVATRLARLEPPARLPGIDLARGLAVIGMFAAHLVVTSSLEWSSPDTWTGLVDGRSSILFATLAGVSLGLTSDVRLPRGHPDQRLKRRRLAARAVIIWALGATLLTLGVPVNVILPAYGALFAIAVVMIGLSDRTLISVAAALAVLMPFVVGLINLVTGGGEEESTSKLSLLSAWHYPFPLWAAFLAAGIVAGRALVASRRSAVRLLGIGTTLAVAGYSILGTIGDRAADTLAGSVTTIGDLGGSTTTTWLLSRLQDEPHSSGMGEAVGSGGFALAVIGLCVLIGSTGLRWVFWPVRVLGSMPLTAYTGHILIWAGWMAVQTLRGGSFDPMDDFRALDPLWPMTLAVMLGCVLWAVFVGRGPFEIAVDKLTRALATDRTAPGGQARD